MASCLVCLCVKLQSGPKESHLSAVKRIPMYLLGTLTLGLWYLKGKNFELVGYSDVDYALYKVNRKAYQERANFKDKDFFLGTQKSKTQ